MKSLTAFNFKQWIDDHRHVLKPPVCNQQVFEENDFIVMVEILLLPPKVPHSPQRFENTVGLVVERKRLDEELDGFMWYCDECDHLLYEEYLYISDIVGQLPPIFDRFYGSAENRTCDNCGAVMPGRD